MEEIRNYFESESSDNDEKEILNDEDNNNMQIEEESESEGFIYDEDDFQKDNIIKFLFDNKLLENSPICYKCHQTMKLVNDKQRVNEKIWRCSKKGNNKL